MPLAIRELPGNVIGRDIFITDPHGCLETLKKVCVGAELKLTAGDRLFIAGDLIDRGPQSLALLRFVNEQNVKKNSFKIHSIRGNHENIVLELIALLKTIEHATKTPNFLTLYTDIIAFFKDETLKVQDLADYVTTWLAKIEKADLSRDERKRLKTLLAHFGNGAGWVLRLNEVECQEVTDFIEPLPYGIQIAGVVRKGIYIKPSEVWHGAPLSPAESKACLKEGNTLTDKQITYVSWARTDKKPGDSVPLISSEGRDRESTRAYLGHNSLKADVPIYQEINAFNLDAHTILSETLYYADHTNNSIGSVSVSKWSCYTNDSPLRALQAQAKAKPSFRVATESDEKNSAEENLRILKKQLIEELTAYQKIRLTQGKYTSCFSALFNGYDRDAKLNATQAFITLLQSGRPPAEGMSSHLGALTNKSLGLRVSSVIAAAAGPKIDKMMDLNHFLTAVTQPNLHSQAVAA